MKHKHFSLMLVSIFLTSCGGGIPSEVRFPLKEGERISLTNEQLTQEEYYSLAERVIDSSDYFGLDFNLSFKSTGGEEFDVLTTGSYNSNKMFGGTFTVKVGKSVWVISDYSEAFEEESYYIQHKLKYLTYDGNLEYGLLMETITSPVITDYSYDPNLPTSYSETDPSFKTTPKEYKAIELTYDLFLNRSLSYLIPIPLATEYLDDDTHLIDRPVYSHEITADYLVLHEKRKALYFDVVAPDGSARKAYYESLIGENSEYYLNSTYYYNYKNGKLAKFECSFCVPRGNKTVGTCTVNFINLHGKEKQEAKNHFKKFLSYKGVERGQERVEW